MTRSAAGLLSLLFGAVLALGTLPAGAAPGPTNVTGLERFEAGNLIADAVMDDTSTMSTADIQTFLNTRGSACVEGTDGSPCLKNATFTSTDRSQTAFCGAYAGATGESAATVISKVSQACGINPQVLLVKLQKEQSLITTTNPTESNYLKSMGFRCPDFQSCEPEYAGFVNQVYSAASRLNEYRADTPGPGQQFTFHVGETKEVAYKPTPPGGTSCGTQTITFETAATAALYNYTPYVPNQAALDAVSGLGDECSAYGNRNFFRFFSTWFGPPNGSEVERVSGTDRYATAAEISRTSFPSGASTVYVANGLTFADALAAAPAAGSDEVPLLLTAANALPASTEAELRRLDPGRIVVLGGESAISFNVARTLGGIAPVERIAGTDRYATAALISKDRGLARPSTVYLANGLTLVDALAITPVAGRDDAPLLLTAHNVLPTATATELARLQPAEIVIIGGEGAVSPAVATAAGTYASKVTRISGPDRYGTAARIAELNFPGNAHTTYLANGVTFADALAVGPVAGRDHAPLLLTRPTELSAPARTQLDRLNSPYVVLVGGEAALGAKVAASALFPQLQQ